jgi:predicted DNA-binding protein
MMKAKYTKQLTIAIPSEHFEKIKRFTDREEISIAAYCREAIAEALKNIHDDQLDLKKILRKNR